MAKLKVTLKTVRSNEFVYLSGPHHGKLDVRATCAEAATDIYGRPKTVVIARKDAIESWRS